MIQKASLIRRGATEIGLGTDVVEVVEAGLGEPGRYPKRESCRRGTGKTSDDSNLEIE
jgi:hypothetical protein